jgi:hypothetical protein
MKDEATTFVLFCARRGCTRFTVWIRDATFWFLKKQDRKGPGPCECGSRMWDVEEVTYGGKKEAHEGAARAGLP